jgi:hypothetical protein
MERAEQTTIGRKAWNVFATVAALGWSGWLVYKAARDGLEGDWLWPVLLLGIVLALLVEVLIWPKLKLRRQDAHADS